MLNEVIKGISMALNTAFGDEYEIRQNDVEQGLVNGSFFIQVLKPELTPLLGRRSMKRNHFDVMYFPKAPGNNAEMFTVAEKLMECLTQIANDIAVLFGKKYIGKVPNDASGRVSLWNDIVKHHMELQNIRAIENFNPDNVTVVQGDTKKAVVVTDYVTPVNAMAQLYMAVYVQ